MNNSKNKWLTLGMLAVVIIAIVVILSITGSPESSPKVTTSGEASLTLISPLSGTVEVGDLQRVRWNSENYAPSTVSINIIRKVGDNPARYELVRTVAAATADDGDAVWVPAATDEGDNTFIQVGCALSPQGCRASGPTQALAVIDTGRFANTASVYQAIEQLNNK